MKMLVMAAVVTAAFAAASYGQTARVCGDISAACESRASFSDQDIPFIHGKGAAVAESEKFYIVVLKSYEAAKIAAKDTWDGCEVGPPDSDRSRIQYAFPKNKVFFARGCYSIENNMYTGVGDKMIALAVFAGRTKAEADLFLRKVKAMDAIDAKGAYLLRISTGFNGT